MKGAFLALIICLILVLLGCTSIRKFIDRQVIEGKVLSEGREATLLEEMGHRAVFPG